MTLRNRSHVVTQRNRFHEQLSNVCHKPAPARSGTRRRMSRNENESDIGIFMGLRNIRRRAYPHACRMPLSTNRRSQAVQQKLIIIRRAPALFERTFAAGADASLRARTPNKQCTRNPLRSDAARIIRIRFLLSQDLPMFKATRAIV